MTPGSIACNLRMYPHFAQNLLTEHGGGFEKARIYLGSLSFAEISMRLPVNTYLAFMLGGLIRKIGCKIRPYETVPGATDAAIEAGIQLLESAFLGEALRRMPSGRWPTCSPRCRPTAKAGRGPASAHGRRSPFSGTCIRATTTSSTRA